MRRFDRLNLSVLPAGTAETSTYELLTSPRLEALLAEARAHYDYVLIDTPPLVLVPDCRLIGRWVDGFLVVVAAHKTPRRLLAEGLNLLDPAKVLGDGLQLRQPADVRLPRLLRLRVRRIGTAQRSRRWWRRVLGIGA